MINFRNVCLLLAGIFILVATAFLQSCTGRNRTFQKSHDSIRPGMTIREVFDSGLADYLISMRNKTAPGVTISEKQPISKTCNRHVFEIYYFDPSFWVRVYCDMNKPSASQVIPEKSFIDKQEFLQALDTVYASWARSMEFRIESPPKRLFGVYDHYNFTLDQEGKVATVSPIIPSP